MPVLVGLVYVALWAGASSSRPTHTDPTRLSSHVRSPTVTDEHDCQVLFVCVKNGGKSQMAAGLLRQLLADRHTSGIEVGSAGTKPGTSLNAAVRRRSLAEVGIDIADQHTRQLTPEPAAAGGPG